MMIEKCILVTGGFDPIHSGHIEYFSKAKEICDYLVVGINSDEWLIRKKGSNFYDWFERESIIRELNQVNKVISFDDKDNSASDAIEECLKFSHKVIFANGGDRGKNNIPESLVYKNNERVEFIFGVGGSNKMNSSSLILKNYLQKYDQFIKSKNNEFDNKTIQLVSYEKPWGKYRILSSGENYKVKDIYINPNGKLSLQFHHKRSEHWVVVNGTGEVQLDDNVYPCGVGDHISIKIGQKHRITNIGDEVLIIIEIALGEYIEEDDIVRLKDIYDRS